MKLLPHIVLSFVFVAHCLTGCGESSSSKDAISLEAAQKLKGTLDIVSTIDDPWNAFETLEMKYYFTIDKCNDKKLVDHVNATRLDLLKKAVEAGNLNAINYLYRKPYIDIENIADVKRKLVPNVLQAAEKLTGLTEVERTVLVISADILRDGQLTIRNSKGATALYAKAWAMGDETAAEHAATLFLNQRDIGNAYLWSLRCTGACKRDRGLSLYDLEESLSLVAIERIQQLARDPSVIETNTIRGSNA